MESKITSKGQITIPKAVREQLGLKSGDRVKFFMHPHGGAVILPVLPPTALRGMLRDRGPRRDRPVSIEEMDPAAAAGAIAAASGGDTVAPRGRR